MTEPPPHMVRRSGGPAHRNASRNLREMGVGIGGFLFGKPAESRLQMFGRGVAWLTMAAVALSMVSGFIAPLTKAPPRPALNDTPEPVAGVQFGVKEAKRRAIFREIAGIEMAATNHANRRFKDAWSRQDDRANVERGRFAGLARKHKVHKSVIYAILEEGLQRKWLGPNRKPLDPRIAPFRLRKR